MSAEPTSDHRLNDALIALSRRVPLTGADAVAVHADVTRRLVRRRSRRRAGAAAFGLVGIAALVSGLILATRAPTDHQVVAVDHTDVNDQSPALATEALSTSTTTSNTAAVATVSPQPQATRQTPWAEVIPDPPLVERWHPVLLEYRGGIFEWGGQVPGDDGPDANPLDDGAWYDSATRAWHPLPVSPLSGGPAFGVAIDGGVVVASHAGEIARYDGPTDTWRSASAPAGAANDLRHLVTVGNEVIFLPSGTRWNVASDTWSAGVASPPLPTETQAVTIGQEVFVVGSNDDQTLASSDRHGAGWVFSLVTDQWTALPESPLTGVGYGVVVAAADGELVVVSTWEMNAAAFSTSSRTWRQLPNLPLPALGCGERPGIVGVRQAIVVTICETSAALSPGAEYWVLFEPPTWSRPLSWVPLGNDRVVLGGHVLAPETAGWATSSSLEIGSVTIGALTIDASVRPENVARRTENLGQGDIPILTVDLATIACTVINRVEPSFDTTSMADAYRLSKSGPLSVTFQAPAPDGTYVMTCPSADSYEAAFRAFVMFDSPSAPLDVTTEFADIRVQGQPESMLSTMAARAETIGGRLDPPGSTNGSDLEFPQPGVQTPGHLYLITADVSVVRGYVFEVTIEPSDAGWMVTRAGLRRICRRGPMLEDPTMCRP